MPTPKEVSEWIDVLKNILTILLGNPIRRYCALLMTVGGCLICQNSLLQDVASLFFESPINDAQDTELARTAQYFGIGMVITSLVTFFSHFFWELREADKKIQRSILTAYQNGNPFDKEQMDWFKRNQKKRKAFFEALANPDLTAQIRESYLQNEWMKL